MPARYQLNCQRCKKPFEATRPDAHYCTDTCRTLAYRDRRAVQLKGQVAQNAMQNLCSELEKPLRKTEAERWISEITFEAHKLLTGTRRDDS